MSGPVKWTRLLLILLLISDVAVAQPVLKIAGQEGDERFFRLISAVYQELGLTTEFSLIPSERALSAVNSGIFAAEIGRIKDPSAKYPNLIYSAVPLLEVQLVALRKKGNLMQLSAAHELRSFRVGYVIGMSVAENFNRQHQLNAFAVTTHIQLAKMLDMGRIDVALMGTAFEQSPVFQVAEQQLVLSTAQVYHIFHKNYAYLAADFDRALLLMKQDGRYHQYLANSPD